MRPQPRGDHVGHRGLHAGERAGEVDRDDAVPDLGRDVEPADRTTRRRRSVTRISTGPSSARTLRESGVDRRPVGHVDLDGHRRAAGGRDLVGGRARGRAVAVEDRDAVAVGDEPLGDAEADARRAAGDDGDRLIDGASHRRSNSRWTFVRPRRIHVGSYSKRRASAGPWCSSDRRMSCIRSRMRSRLTRPSTRASGPPGHEWAPRPKAMWACGVGPVDAELGRALEAPRIAVGRAVEQHHRRAGRDVDAADGGGRGG